ncbi:T9SS type A sorting domain-containing protein [Emticicia sp. 17c]|uniref:T9SS type A sorting domain-containing protein n=1 Tax=Emticicia sp. 17c TaxID=3127704 RepID=UPI00301C3A7F
MKKILLLIACFGFQFVFAQEKITNFDNLAVTIPDKAQLTDTLRGRLVFLTLNPEEGSTMMWSTDGTPQNTIQLKDQWGQMPLYGTKVKKYGYLYLKGSYFWRTDGTTVERLFPDIDSLRVVYDFNQYLLFGFNTNTASATGKNILYSSVGWLDSLHHINIWEKDIISCQMIDSTFHFLKFNTQTQYYELGKVKKDGTIIKKTIEADGITIENFKYATRNSIEYYFFYTNKDRQLLAQTTDIDKKVVLKDWGPVSQSFPIILKDTAQNVYFTHHFGDLTIFAISDSNQITEKWRVSMQSLVLMNDVLDTYSLRTDNTLIVGNKLLFNTTVGGEGINKYYFNALNLNTGVNRRSKNLIEYFRFYYGIMDITPVDSNTYILDNKVGQKYTYSFLKDSVINITNYPFSWYADTTFMLNGRKLLVSGNVYDISRAEKIPMIAPQQIYTTQQDATFYNYQLGDKLLFIKYNPIVRQYQLWVSDGERDHTRLLVNLSGTVYDAAIKELNGKIYFYTGNYSPILAIYETDGTVEGTKQVFRYEAKEMLRVEWIKNNNRQIICLFYRTSGKGEFVVVEDEEAYLVTDTSPETYGFDIQISTTDTYLIKKVRVSTYKNYHDFFRVDKGQLKLIDTNVLLEMVYKDRVIYGKVVSDKSNELKLYWAGKDGLPSILSDENINGYTIYGDKLLYQQYVEQTSTKVFSIIDLTTSQTEISKVKNEANVYNMAVGNTIILTNYLKVLIITGKNLKEYKLEYRADNGLIPFSNGFLICGSRDLTYYDLSNNQVIPIVKNKLYSIPVSNSNKATLFITITNENTDYSHNYWTLANKKLVPFEVASYFSDPDLTQVFSSTLNNDNTTVWRFSGGELVKSYQFPNYLAYNVKIVGNNFYSYYTVSAEKGNELIGLGRDSVTFYPEIIKGPEGIMLGTLFEFKQQLYAYAFTRSYGWQVWKMAKIEPLILGEEPEKTFMVFPNPAQDYININLVQPYQYRIINSTGQQVMEGNFLPDCPINIQPLAKGLYIIRLYHGEDVYTRKIIKE